jgi:Mg2+ and Co2+ transporter CorA
MYHDHFNNTGEDMSAVSNILTVVLLQALSWIANYANPIIGTLSLTGSAVYIWLKIRKEFIKK